ncbi:hypothetical protein O5560_28180, partial [Escherichia coli]|nr:hypothetical protein [Escherichia coli]
FFQRFGVNLNFDIGRMAAQMLLSKIKNNDHNHNTVDLGYQIYHGNTL